MLETFVISCCCWFYRSRENNLHKKYGLSQNSMLFLRWIYCIIIPSTEWFLSFPRNIKLRLFTLLLKSIITTVTFQYKGVGISDKISCMKKTPEKNGFISRDLCWNYAKLHLKYCGMCVSVRVHVCERGTDLFTHSALRTHNNAHTH